MKYIATNRAVRCVVERRVRGRFPVTVTFELGNEIHEEIRDLDQLERMTKYYGIIPGTPVFRQHAWDQLHE